MKIAVIKLGARITWDTDAAVGPGEAISICKALLLGGAEVHIFTKILTKDTLDSSITWHNIIDDLDTSNMDVLLVINGNVNFFGGSEDRAQILNYHIINNFKGAVRYVMCDPELPLMQIWPSVSVKEWSAGYSKTDIEIIRQDIVVLSQPTDLVNMTVKWKRKKGTAPIENMRHFPFERFPLLNEHLVANSVPSIDLLYGGTTRGGRRVPNLFKWYFGLPNDISVEIFGKIDLDDFIKHPKIGHDAVMNIEGFWPKFSGMVKYCDVLPKMNLALAHLVTGDPSYEELDIIPQRTYECIAAGNIVFIDAAMDKSRRIYPVGTMVHDFLYVENQVELIDRLRIIKADESIKHELLDLQRLATNFNAELFCKSLVKSLI